MSFIADQHRDWHTVASLEGVNSWECPWDCEADRDPEDGPKLWAWVWYRRPGDKPDAPEIGYPVFSRGQARRFAQVAAERSGRAARVEIHR